MNGWGFTPEDYVSAAKQGKLLTAQIENSNYCNLDCEYCFRGGFITGNTKFDNVLPRDKLHKAINCMDMLGVKTINIIGAGEPLLDPDLENLLNKIFNKGITPVVATNGSLITSHWVEVFQQTQTSLILKMNSLDMRTQNDLVRMRGYAKKRDYGLSLLMEAGFNMPTEAYRTRLGINSIVMQKNKGEVLDILRYCRRNNIMPVMATFIPCGRTENRTDQEVGLKEFLDISGRAREQDLREDGISYARRFPYLGGVPCTQCGESSIYLTISGDIYECPGQMKYFGNLRETTIQEAFERIKLEVKNMGRTCPPRIKRYQK